MSGAGFAVSHGPESALHNSALITSVKNTEISFGGTHFMPDISATFYPGTPVLESDADMNVIPEVSIAHKLTENWYVGGGTILLPLLSTLNLFSGSRPCMGAEN